ncbi:hypothetical protein H7H51_16495 [Mycolicibacterium farcinogenes]|nr:hypothetical protein [Mycolicibacterium farcinogenes]
MASVLTREAEQILAIRDGLDRQSDWLGSMSRVTGAVGSLSPAGHAAQTRAEMEMVARAVRESTSQLMTMRDNADVNAAEARDAVSLYAGKIACPRQDGVGNPETPTEDLTEVPEEDAEGAADPSADANASAPTLQSAGITAQASPSVPAGSTPPASAAPVAGAPQPAAAAAGSPVAPGSDVAGALAGVIGSIVGVVGGIAQAAAQAAQIATQTAGQAAQMASQPDDSAGAGADSVNGTDTADEPEERENGKDDESVDDGRGATGQSSGEGVLPDAPAGAGPVDDSAGEGNDGPAMTLPPDLAAASAGMAGQDQRTVYVSTDLEHGQLRRPVPATLERGIPGSAAVLDQAEVLE